MKTFFSKRLRRFIILFVTSTVSFGLLEIVNAYTRPSNPVMDYVPQNIGVYDTYYENFHESDCRACHGASTAERHHGTNYAFEGNCQLCHLIWPSSSQPERDCKVCHIDGGPIGNFGNPHHKSQSVSFGMCNQCHFHVVRTYSVQPPLYAPTSTTPTPYSCENCHWPSGRVPHQSATYDGNTFKFLADWQSWSSYPVPTTWPDGLAHPQPIEANGPIFIGNSFMKPYRPTEGTHHKLSANVYNRCNYCHASTPDSIPDWNPNNPYLIRFCENCHDVGSLHNIQEHVNDNDIYRVGGMGNQLVTTNTKCVACHRNYMGELPPTIMLDRPEIGRLEPNFGPPGITVNIFPASEVCFNEDPVNGLCSFGLQTNGDSVRMGQKDINSNWYWVDAPIQSWSENLIQIKVPDRSFQSGKTVVEVHKKLTGTSTFKVFVVLHNPVITFLTPSYAAWGQEVLVGGDGFSVEKENIYDNGYGYSAYIVLQSVLHSEGKQYRVTRYSWQQPWYPNKVLIGLTDLLDIGTGNLVHRQDLDLGCWKVMMVVDYFKDNPVDGTPGKYNLGMGGLDPADKLVFKVVSEPVWLTVTEVLAPFIDVISPDRVPNGGFFEIYGVNFGSVQGISSTSYVRGGTDSALIEILGNGKGNEDGICQKAEYLANDCTLDPAKSRIVPIINWSSTQIICDLPTLSAGLPLRVHVQVVVDGTKKSNVKKIVIY